jgi:hypothetical protein
MRGPANQRRPTLKTFDVQSVEMKVASDRAFAYIADPSRLPDWTSAFASVRGRRALLRTPNGEVEIDLAVEARAEAGTVDWRMTFPDGSVANAYSRLVPLAGSRCIYSFVLTPPPVPLAELEGALEAQSRTLSQELARLRRTLEGNG